MTVLYLSGYNASQCTREHIGCFVDKSSRAIAGTIETYESHLVENCELRAAKTGASDRERERERERYTHEDRDREREKKTD